MPRQGVQGDAEPVLRRRLPLRLVCGGPLSAAGGSAATRGRWQRLLVLQHRDAAAPRVGCGVYSRRTRRPVSCPRPGESSGVSARYEPTRTRARAISCGSCAWRRERSEGGGVGVELVSLVQWRRRESRAATSPAWRGWRLLEGAGGGVRGVLLLELVGVGAWNFRAGEIRACGWRGQGGVGLAGRGSREVRRGVCRWRRGVGKFARSVCPLQCSLQGGGRAWSGRLAGFGWFRFGRRVGRAFVYDLFLKDEHICAISGFHSCWCPRRRCGLYWQSSVRHFKICLHRTEPARASA